MVPKFRMYPLRINNVLDLHRQRDMIDLEPPYQRLSVWDNEKQRRFIDSVINGIDTPKLYFHNLADRSTMTKQFRYSVIDGKQRMLALWAFIDGDLTLPNDFRYFDNENYQAAGLNYGQLLSKVPTLRAHFDSFDVPVILVHAENDEFIEQLFWRLNVQVPLTAPEKRNVLGGPLPLLIRKVGLASFFRESVRVRNDRLQHYDLAAKFIYVCQAKTFVSTKKSHLDNFVLSMKQAREKDDRAASPRALQNLEKRTLALLDIAHAFFGEDSDLLRSMGRIALYFQAFRLCTNMEKDVPFDVDMLEQFNGDVTIARQKSQRMASGSGEELSPMEEQLLLFDREKQSTNDAGALQRQYDHMRHYMAEKFDVELPAGD